MKRLISVILILCMICQFTGCKTSKDKEDDAAKSGEKQEKVDESVDEETDEEVAAAETEANAEETEDTQEETADASSTTEAANQSGNTTSSNAATGNATAGTTSTPVSKPTKAPVVSGSSTTTETKVTELEKVEEVEVPEIKNEVAVNTSHTALRASDYYQYSFLTSTEKTIYQMICQAISNGEAYVNLSSYNCSKDMVAKLYKVVLADNPQFFYLANRYAYTISGQSQGIEQLILFYTDGTKVDEMDDSGKIIVNANRTTISQQISKFNNKVAEIVKTIPTSASAVQKEKKIYDYLQDSITYDYDAANSIAAFGGGSHAYDAYGAACEGKAVCEGYAELFQYLCYCVGINATQVDGTASGGSHMWNAVCIDSAWYMLDATWDDSGTDGLHYYNYFNLTSSEMGKSHRADSSALRVPSCTSTTHAFYRHFALRFESQSAAPANYQTVIDSMVANGESYLILYAGNQAQNMGDYISNQIFASQCAVQKYIKQKGYNIDFETTYYIVEQYCYIHVNK